MKMRVVLLSEVASIGAGQSAPKDNEFNSSEGLPFIRAGHLENLILYNNIKDLPKVSDSYALKNRLRVIKKGSILFAKSGMSAMMNRVYLVTQDSYFVSHLASVTPNESYLDSRFCYFFLKFFGTSKLIKDSAYPSIGLPDIQSIKTPLPPLETQKRIADILDAADALRQKDQELIKKYDELAQAIFTDMFGDPVKNEKGWIRYYGKELIEVLGGAAFSSKDYTSSGIPLIRIGTINKGYLDSTQLVYLPDSYFEKFKKYIIKPKDLLITLTGTAGKDDYGNVYEMEETLSYGLLNQRVAKLLLDIKKINSRYLTYYLKQKDVKAELTGISRGVRQGNISNSDLYNLNIMLPPIELQNAFDKKVTSILNVKDNQLLNINKSDSLFSSILIKAFNGELVA